MRKKLLLMAMVLFCLLNCQRVYADSYPEIVPENLTSHYGYDYLGTLEHGKNMQEAYNRMVDAAWDFYCSDEPAEVDENHYGHLLVDVSDLSLTGDEYKHVEACFDNDNPIFYFCKDCFGTKTHYDYREGTAYLNKIDIYITMEYHIAEEDYITDDYTKDQMVYRKMIETKLHEYYDYVRTIGSDHEKVRAIHNKLCKDIEFYGEMDNSSHNIIGAFQKGLSVCDGYSQTFEILCNYCGVNAIKITGVGKGESHAWNAVKFDGEWYCVDVLWDDMNHKISEMYSYYYSNAYINVEEKNDECYIAMPYKEFKKDHFSYAVAGWDIEDNIEYPDLSDKDTYWNIYIMDNGKNGNTDEEKIICLKQYIKECINNGKMFIPIYRLSGSFEDYMELETAALDAAFSELYNETGKVYRRTPDSLPTGAGYTSESSVRYALICVSQYVEKEKYSYYRGNTINGIYLTDYSDYNDSTPSIQIPEKIDGITVTTLATKYEWNQNARLVFPDGLLTCNYVRADQLVVNEGLQQIYTSGLDISTNGIYLPQSVKCISLPDVISNFSIYGYKGSAAYEYAQENNLRFVDVTGLELIKQADLPEMDEPVMGGNVPKKSKVYENEQLNVFFEWDTLDEKFLKYGKYKGVYTLETKDGYALTPNTLLSIAGNPVIIDNKSAKKAVYTFSYSMNEGIVSENGTCGENVQWQLTEKNNQLVLTVSKIAESNSDGAMDAEFNTSKYKWWEAPISVDKVIIEDGITEIYNMTGIRAKQIEIADTVEVIGADCFSSCQIESLTLPQSIKSIGENAFAGCIRLKKVSNNSSVSFTLPEIENGWVNEDNLNGEKISSIANGTALHWKADKAPGIPDNSEVWEVPNEQDTVKMVALNGDWRWIHADMAKELKAGEICVATAEYIGEDKGDYLVEQVEIQIMRRACLHKKSELLNVSDASCLHEGYTGDLICYICGEIVEKGTVIPSVHEGGTEVREAKEATATEDGYTGDIYCLGCGEMIKEGTVIKATGTSTGSSGDKEKPETATTPTDDKKDPETATTPSDDKKDPETATTPSDDKKKPETTIEIPSIGKKLTSTDINVSIKVTNSGKLVNGKITGAEAAYEKPAIAASKITIPDTITIDGVEYIIVSISDNAFKNDKKLKKVTIGKNINTIGKNAFSGCKKLNNITIKSTNLKKIGKNAFKDINKKAVIKVPKKLYGKYKKLFKANSGFKKTMRLKKI